MKMPELKELPTQEDIDRLERENAELKSQVEQLRDFAELIVEWKEYGFQKAQALLDLTPMQCLAEVKAQAYKEGYVSALITHTDEPTAWCNEQAYKHLEQIRQQANPFDKINKARDEASSALQNWINEAGE